MAATPICDSGEVRLFRHRFSTEPLPGWGARRTAANDRRRETGGDCEGRGPDGGAIVGGLSVGVGEPCRGLKTTANPAPNVNPRPKDGVLRPGLAAGLQPAACEPQHHTRPFSRRFTRCPQPDCTSSAMVNRTPTWRTMAESSRACAATEGLTLRGVAQVERLRDRLLATGELPPTSCWRAHCRAPGRPPRFSRLSGIRRLYPTTICMSCVPASQMACLSRRHASGMGILTSTRRPIAQSRPVARHGVSSCCALARCLTASRATCGQDDCAYHLGRRHPRNLPRLLRTAIASAAAGLVRHRQRQSDYVGATSLAQPASPSGRCCAIMILHISTTTCNMTDMTGAYHDPSLSHSPWRGVLQRRT